jgi:hypothetical protein
MASTGTSLARTQADEEPSYDFAPTDYHSKANDLSQVPRYPMASCRSPDSSILPILNLPVSVLMSIDGIV